MNDIEDIVHNIFLQIYSNGAERVISNPAGYLARAARNALVDRSRRRNPLNYTLPIAMDDEDFVIDPQQECDQQAEDLMHAYEAALTELSPRCREVFVHRRHHDAATPDIAERFGISHRMVQKYLAKATAHLEVRLRPFLNDDAPDHADTAYLCAARSARAPSYRLCDLV